MRPRSGHRDNEDMELMATTTGSPSTEEELKNASADAAEKGLRFEDPYWDDAFCAWWDPTLRTCC